VVGAFYFIYHQLKTKNTENWHVLFDKLTLVSGFLVLLFTIFNWFFEVLKWQYLVHCFTNISFKKAFEQTFAAYTTSVFTPARVGEYGAKALYYPKKNTKQIVLLTFLGSGFQMFVTCLFGVLGLFLAGYFSWAFLFLGAVLVGFLVVFSLKNISFKGISIQKGILKIKELPKSNLQKVFLFSLVRYLIFSHQYFLLLYISGISVDYFSCMAVIFIMYALVSIIPSLQIADVVVRGGLSVFLFQKIGIDEWLVVTVTGVMWLLNVVIPVILGSFFVLNIQVPIVKKIN